MKSQPVLRRAAIAVAATATLLMAGPAASGTGLSGGDVRMNQIQFMGAHNAYHREMQLPEVTESLKIDPGLPSWAYYSHASIPTQLDRQHVRHVELDIYPDPQGGLYSQPLPRKRLGLPPLEGMSEPGFKVMHVADVDYNTSCRTFVVCMRQVRDWSRAHRSHVPIVVQVELKQTDDRWEQLGGAVAPPWDAKLLDDVDKEIRSVFTESELLTPDDLLRPGMTLEQSVLKYGWPKLSSARGKVMFFFDNVGTGGSYLPMYLDGHPNLSGRAVFAQGYPGDPYAAVMQVNDPRGENSAKIADLVRRGYFVRTRSDEGQKTIRDNDLTRHDVAMGSGAQLLTTDYPSVGMTARWNSDFVAELPGGTPVRCNPVNAPRGCSAPTLER
jgi:hypothetical protein